MVKKFVRVTFVHDDGVRQPLPWIFEAKTYYEAEQSALEYVEEVYKLLTNEYRNTILEVELEGIR